MSAVLVVGGGLAGCEAAWQLAERGHDVTLLEMRPVRTTPAHQTALLAELVCTNSFKSSELTNAHGLLKHEMRVLGSILLQSADSSRVPGGTALVVDRDIFAREMTARMQTHPRICVERRELTSLPDGPTIIATGPLTSDALSQVVQQILGDEGLAFYDSIAPIVALDSVNLDIAWFESRYGKGDGDDYLNCPFDRAQYEAFISALREADTYPGHAWENLSFTEAGDSGKANIPYFEGCLPIEVMAWRGEDTLRFGPMKPVGLRDPRTDRRAHAVLQLRREDAAGQMWNMVGCQTRLRTGEQRRIFRMVPGLENAELLRTGSIHRNTYLNFPARLNAYGAPPARADIIFAGQLTGVEGYTESAASGILAGINMDRLLRGAAPTVPPATTMIGALYRYLRDAEPGRFQPMNSNFGLIEPLEVDVRDKHVRKERMVDRALLDFAKWIRAHDIEIAPARERVQHAEALT